MIRFTSRLGDADVSRYRRTLDLLSADEIALMLAADPGWCLPAGCSQVKARMVEARDVLRHLAYEITRGEPRPPPLPAPLGEIIDVAA